MIRRARMTAPALLVMGLVSSIVHAQEQPPQTDHDKALARFDEARKLIDAGKCGDAVPKLEESIRYEPSIGAHLSFADCLEPLDALHAWVELREAERLAYVKHDERSKFARTRSSALEPKLAMVHLSLPPAIVDEPSLEIRLDGALVDRYFTIDGAIAMKPGAHVLDATMPHKKWSQSVTAELGQVATVTVALKDDEPTPTVAAPKIESPPRDTGSAQRTAGIVLGALGLASLGAGVGFGVVALLKKSDINSACGGSASTCQASPGSQDSALSDQKTFAHLSTVALLLGGGLAITGAVLVLTTPKASTVALTTNGSGLSVVGRW